MVEILRLLLLAVAGIVLFRFCRHVSSGDRTIRFLVVSGFLVRVAGSLALFWIAFLDLPPGRSLRMPNGTWFFAQDASIYTASAAKAANDGLLAIATVPRTSPSVTYIQGLSVFSYLFGHPAGASLLLNLFCYLGACAILKRWSETIPEGRVAALVGIGAITLSPGGTLWSLQPLKDTYFQFLVVAFIGACFLWRHAWRSERPYPQAALAAVLMTVLLYLASGVRWYIGLSLLGVAMLFIAVGALTVKQRRIAALAVSAIVIVVLSRAFAFVTAPYLPPVIRAALELRPSGLWALPATIHDHLDASRAAFEHVGGGTAIRTGDRVAVRRQTEAKPAPPQIEAPPPAAAVQPSAPPPEPAPSPEPAPPPEPAPAPTIPTTLPEVQEAAAPGPPLSRAERLFIGAVAASVPRFIASRLGLVDIGAGGRASFWLFVDLDTLVFDAVFLLAVAFFLANLRGSMRNGLFLLVLGVTILIAGGLLYTVTNFGALFRLRLMIFTPLALIPLAIMTVPRRTPERSESEVAAADPVVARPAANG